MWGGWGSSRHAPGEEDRTTGKEGTAVFSGTFSLPPFSLSLLLFVNFLRNFISLKITILIVLYCHCNGTSQVAHMIKNPPAMQETWVQSLDQEVSLETGMATH